jgi:hypothetical protein
MLARGPARFSDAERVVREAVSFGNQHPGELGALDLRKLALDRSHACSSVRGRGGPQGDEKPRQFSRGA